MFRNENFQRIWVCTFLFPRPSPDEVIPMETVRRGAFWRIITVSSVSYTPLEQNHRDRAEIVELENDRPDPLGVVATTTSAYCLVMHKIIFPFARSGIIVLTDVCAGCGNTLG